MDLPAVIFHKQVKVRVVIAVCKGGQSGEVTGYQHIGADAAGQSGQMGIDSLRLFGQTHFFQSNRLSLKGGGVENIAAGFGILPLQGHQLFGIGKDPLFRAAAPGHTHLLQIGAGGTVQKKHALVQFFVKLFFRQHTFMPPCGLFVYYRPHEEIMQED